MTYGKTFKSQYQWQYFGIPVERVTAYPTFTGASLRMYNEKLNADSSFYNKWLWLNNESELEAFKGYSITQENPTTYNIAGKLLLCDTTLTLTRQASAVAVGEESGLLTQNIHYGLGQNLFANSYTTPIFIPNMGGFSYMGGTLENTIYLYNTGSFHKWTSGKRETEAPKQQSAGNWLAIPKYGSAIWENQIPSMQGFMIKFRDSELAKGPDESTETIRIAPTKPRYTINTKPLLSPSKTTSSPHIGAAASNFYPTEETDAPLSYLRVNLESTSTRDVLWLISRESTTNHFDNGWDGRKYFGTPTAFIFTQNKDGLMQVNADKTINGSIISFYANADTEYELTLIKSNLDQYDNLYLHDLKAQTSIALDSDTTFYPFIASNKGCVEKRFVILNSSKLNLKEGSIDLLDAYLKPEGTLVVSNLSGSKGQASIYDTAGRMLLCRDMPAGTTEIQLGGLSKGVYLVNLRAEEYQETVKIVVK